jgi:hypothetical protein
VSERHGDGLEGLLGERFAVLSGCRAPGSRSVFGDVVLGPTGVFVVQPLDGQGAVRVRREEVTLEAESLVATLQRLRRQGLALQMLLADALTELELRVRPVLWTRAARLGLRRVAFSVRLATTRDVRRMIAKGGTLLPASEVRRLVSLAQMRLIPAEGLSA